MDSLAVKWKFVKVHWTVRPVVIYGHCTNSEKITLLFFPFFFFQFTTAEQCFVYSSVCCVVSVRTSRSAALFNGCTTGRAGGNIVRTPNRDESWEKRYKRLTKKVKKKCKEKLFKEEHPGKSGECSSGCGCECIAAVTAPLAISEAWWRKWKFDPKISEKCVIVVEKKIKFLSVQFFLRTMIIFWSLCVWVCVFFLLFYCSKQLVQELVWVKIIKKEKNYQKIRENIVALETEDFSNVYQPVSVIVCVRSSSPWMPTKQQPQYAKCCFFPPRSSIVQTK